MCDRQPRDGGRRAGIGAQVTVRGAAFIGSAPWSGRHLRAARQAAVIAGSAVWLSFLFAGLVTALLALQRRQARDPVSVTGRADRVPAAGLRERTAARRRVVARVCRRLRGRGRDARRLLRELRDDAVHRRQRMERLGQRVRVAGDRGDDLVNMIGATFVSRAASVMVVVLLCVFGVFIAVTITNVNSISLRSAATRRSRRSSPASR